MKTELILVNYFQMLLFFTYNILHFHFKTKQLPIKAHVGIRKSNERRLNRSKRYTKLDKLSTVDTVPNQVFYISLVNPEHCVSVTKCYTHINIIQSFTYIV